MLQTNVLFLLFISQKKNICYVIVIWVKIEEHKIEHFDRIIELKNYIDLKFNEGMSEINHNEIMEDVVEML